MRYVNNIFLLSSNSFLSPVFITASKVRKRLFLLLIIALDKVWHFFHWLLISALAASIIGNFAFALLTQCKPTSCVSFTNPYGWPIVGSLLSHPLRTQTATIFLADLFICALIAHRDLCKLARSSKGKEIGGVTIVPVTNLLANRLNLGDDAAANFSYISTPIKNIYSESIETIQKASTIHRRDKWGILLTGESNAGKTRLAFETMKQVLPHWDVLCWMPNCTLKEGWDVEAIDTKHLIIFIDDLQNYIGVHSSLIYE